MARVCEVHSTIIIFLGGWSTACLSKQCPPFFLVLQGGLINFEKRRRVNVAPHWHNQSLGLSGRFNFLLVPAGVRGDRPDQAAPVGL